MTEEEAKARCAKLAAEHSDRKTTNWVPVKQQNGTWAVARIPLPPPVDPNQTQPAHPDPRPPGEDHRQKPWLNP